MFNSVVESDNCSKEEEDEVEDDPSNFQVMNNNSDLNPNHINMSKEQKRWDNRKK